MKKVHDIVIFYLTLAQSGEGDSKSAEAYLSAALSLTLPGKVLNMSALVYQKKFRYAGNKSGGLRGWEMLQSAGLGEIHEEKAARGTDKVFRPGLQLWLTFEHGHHSYNNITINNECYLNGVFRSFFTLKLQRTLAKPTEFYVQFPKVHGVLQ